ncbi:MAG: tetratricopeptide repeat protein [Candidatus Competibacteraceae bacterium]|nr:tetratricopeptide repeat protein [Candidatus Competibacteraceae bacterium]
MHMINACRLTLRWILIKWVLLVFVAPFLFTPMVSAFAAPPCGNISNAYGPFDYTDPEHHEKKLPVVEHFHFTPEVESLIRGKSGHIWGDLDYTLRAFPNHHRALYAFVRYELRERKKSQQENKPYKPQMAEGGYPMTAECYFDRAIRWRPNDPTVRLLHGLFLHLSGNLEQALAEYEISERMQPNSADLQYNLGLLYFDKKQYVLAKEHAKKAYQLGYPLPGLRKKLTGVGQWP